MIGLVGSLLSGGFGKLLARAYEDHRAAQSEAERLAAAERIARLESAQAVRLATVGRWSVEVPSFIAGMSMSCHLALVAYASTPYAPLGFVVHKLPAPMDQWQGAIILSFFGLSAATSLARGLMVRRHL